LNRIYLTKVNRMDCQTAHDHLSAYLDHTLTMPTRELLDTHLGECPQCRRELRQLQTVIAWVRDLPTIQPSPTFLPQVHERVEQLSRRSLSFFFRRLAGALPLPIAAALMLVVSTALFWQLAPQVWQQHTQPQEPAAPIRPPISLDRLSEPAGEVPSLEPMVEDLGPVPLPLVYAPAARPVATWGERSRSSMAELPDRSMGTGLQSAGPGREITLFPRVILRAADPGQVAQQMGAVVGRLGGTLLESRRMATPAGRTEREPWRVVLSLRADSYQSLLDAIRRFPGIAVVEERGTLVGHKRQEGSPASSWQAETPQEARSSRLTLVIMILPR
jgi:predicted anti-sigma-YlaC factor YlaD